VNTGIAGREEPTRGIRALQCRRVKEKAENAEVGSSLYSRKNDRPKGNLLKEGDKKRRGHVRERKASQSGSVPHKARSMIESQCIKNKP